LHADDRQVFPGGRSYGLRKRHPAALDSPTVGPLAPFQVPARHGDLSYHFVAVPELNDGQGEEFLDSVAGGAA
jgi:hypothetical protein